MLEKWREFVNSDDFPENLGKWLDSPLDFKLGGEAKISAQLSAVKYHILSKFWPEEGKENRRFTLQELQIICQKKKKKLTKAVVSRMIHNLASYMADASWLTDGKTNSQGEMHIIKTEDVVATPFRLVRNPTVKAEFQDYLADLAQLACQPQDLIMYHRREAEKLREQVKR